MADRLAIIGGDTKDRDHFPYPAVITSLVSPTGVGTGYPLVPDIEDATTWFYVRRRWQFTATLNYRIIPPPGTGSFEEHVATVSFDFEHKVSPDNDTYFLPTREAELLLYRDPFIDIVVGDDGTLESSTATIDVQNVSYSDSGATSLVGFAQIALLWVPVNPYWDGNSLVMKVQVDWRIIYDTNLSSNWAPSQTTELGSLNVDGYGVPVQGDVFTPVAELESFSGELTAIESWPYATSDGLPVYDTATGAILRDPFS